MDLSLTQLLIIVNTCMYFRYDIVSIYLQRYAIFSPSFINNFSDFLFFIVPQFSHANFIHLLINMFNLSKIGPITEIIFGEYYIPLIIVISIFNSTFYYLLSLIAYYVYNINSIYYSRSLGFSGILFCLKYFYYSKLNSDINLYGNQVNSKYMIWYELFISQFLIPNASFVGHLSGILSGILLEAILL